MSEACRVEAAYGDLEQHYMTDRLETLISAFAYSADDERNGVSNPTRITIAGSVRNGLASLKQSLRCYQRFSDESRVQK